jgi:hypothetical protein
MFRFTSSDDWLKVTFIPHVVARFGRDPGAMLNSIAGALLTLCAIASLPLVRRRFGMGYAAFVAAIVAMIATGAGDFIGSARYLGAAFPLAALQGSLVAGRPVIRTTLLALGFAGVLVLTFCFTHAVNLGW